MKRSILIAEDHEGVLKVFQEWLPRHGYAVLTARTGTEAVTIANQQRPRICILDYAMPGTDGISAARAIRETPGTSHIPIIMMTAMAIINPDEEAALRGFDAFFGKPFEMDALLAKIRELLKPRVLVIDDEKLYRNLIVRALRATCSVIMANDGKEGMERVVLEDPDLVIIDRSMPGRRGDEVAADIIRYCNIPVIMATGDLLSDTEKETLTAIGIKAILGKPFEISDLQTTIAALLPQLSPPSS